MDNGNGRRGAAGKGGIDVRLVLGLGALGGAIGLATVFGVVPIAWDPYVWTALAFVIVITVTRRRPDRAFAHTFASFLLARFLAADAQAILLSTFLANQPAAQNATEQLPEGTPLGTWLLLGGLVQGAIFGALLGGVAWLSVRLTRPREGAEAGLADDSSEE